MNILNEINVILKSKNINATLNNSNIDKTFKEIGIDSLASMTVVIGIEEKFNVTIADDVLMEIKTPKDLITTIEGLLKK